MLKALFLYSKILLGCWACLQVPLLMGLAEKGMRGSGNMIHS